MANNCSVCGKVVSIDSEIDDETRSSMTGALGYGFDPRTFLAFQCNCCGKRICLQCAGVQTIKDFMKSHDCLCENMNKNAGLTD
jgi:hypothetical protein